MNELHEIQSHILNKLMFSTGLHYSEMKPDKEMENNQFQFHLDQLVKRTLVEKLGDMYVLTYEGKQYVKKMDNATGKLIKQPHLSVRMCCIRKSKDTKENEYLFYTRLKHPYYGCQGFPAGKLEYGEILAEAAQRELMEETGLAGEPKLAIITHYLDNNKQGECINDKLMFLFIIQNPSGTLVESIEGKYAWIKRSEVTAKILKPFENIKGVLHELDLIDNFDGTIKVIETQNEVEAKF